MEDQSEREGTSKRSRTWGYTGIKDLLEGVEIHPWGTGASSEKWRESGRWMVLGQREKP